VSARPLTRSPPDDLAEEQAFVSVATSAPGASPSDSSRPEPQPQRLANWWRRDARFDLAASLVVFLVAVPLSLGIAVASGAPVAAGLIAAAVGGIVAGLLGGSPLQVSGPAAGLTVVVAETVNTFGWRTTCAITAAAGLVQIVLGVSRVGRYALAISPTVVRAMLAGIGVSIVLGQLNIALGGSSRSSAFANLKEYGTTLASVHVQSLIAASLVVALLFAWPRLPARVRVVPGPLVAVVGVTVLAAFVLPDAERVDLGGSLLSQIGLPRIGEVSWLAFAGAVVTVAVIASVESLLSAVAVDKLHGRSRANLDRELLGQGSANALSGMVGGLPITGVIVRSATNVAAGARTRASAVLHGVWVLAFSLLLAGLVEQIPLAALAGLLIVMGIQLVKPADIREAHARGEAWIYLATVLGVLAMNLVEGVLIGLSLALLIVLWRMARVRVDVRRAGDGLDGREHWVVEVRGTLSFLSVPRLVKGLGSVPEGHAVEVDLLVDYMDAACEEQLELWRSRYTSHGGDVVVERPSGTREQVRPEKATVLSPRSFLPWPHWQNGDAPTATHRLAHGIREYHRRGTPALAPVYEELVGGQSPDAFFLSCVDSRVVPNLLTSSGPGDLFTTRTMGNLVPTLGTPDASVAAPLAYAIDALDVPTVVVCGHSGCGAMKAALAPPASAVPGDPVAEWMVHAQPSIEEWRGGHPVGRAAAEAGYGEADQLSQVNVAVGLDHLRAYAGERAEGLTFVGLWLRVADGSLLILRPGENGEDDRFVELTPAELRAFTSVL
jgi:carbonic anhydrase